MSKRYRQLKRNRYYHARDFGFCRDMKCPHCRGSDEILSEGPEVCWCGVKNPYFAEVSGSCCGTGTLDCYCGGDLCVCHNHGEVECLGCSECRHDDYDEDYGDHVYYGVAAN